jgi:hypothetical protein
MMFPSVHGSHERAVGVVFLVGKFVSLPLIFLSIFRNGSVRIWVPSDISCAGFSKYFSKHFEKPAPPAITRDAPSVFHFYSRKIIPDSEVAVKQFIQSRMQGEQVYKLMIPL